MERETQVQSTSNNPNNPDNPSSPDGWLVGSDLWVFQYVFYVC